MDKDSRDDFTFAKLCDIKLPVTFRMYGISDLSIYYSLSRRSQLEGVRKLRTATEILDNPELRVCGVQSSSVPPLFIRVFLSE